MNKKAVLLLAFCCVTAVSCSKPGGQYANEAKSKIVDAKAGQEFSEYAVYNPEISAETGIEAEDAEYAAGVFRLTDPTADKLKRLSEMDNVTTYYNQTGQVIIEIKGK